MQSEKIVSTFYRLSFLVFYISLQENNNALAITINYLCNAVSTCDINRPLIQKLNWLSPISGMNDSKAKAHEFDS